MITVFTSAIRKFSSWFWSLQIHPQWIYLSLWSQLAYCTTLSDSFEVLLLVNDTLGQYFVFRCCKMNHFIQDRCLDNFVFEIRRELHIPVQIALDSPITMFKDWRIQPTAMYFEFPCPFLMQSRLSWAAHSMYHSITSHAGYVLLSALPSLVFTWADLFPHQL